MKLDRLLAIVMMLLNRRRVRTRELARYFEVSRRTIYRDIDAINRAGIPVVSYMGADGGFGLVDSYRIDGNVLTRADIDSIVVALKGVRSAVDSAKVGAALEKVRGLLSEEDLDRFERNAYPTYMDYSAWSESAAEKERLRRVSEAIDTRRVIRFTYLSTKVETTRRSVEPLTLIFKEFTWYLHAYCRKRKDYRLFRIRRMRDVELMEGRFERAPATIPALSIRDGWSGDAPWIDLALRFAPSARLRVVDRFNEEHITLHADGTSVVRFPFPDVPWVYEMILSFGGDVEVLKPAHVRAAIRQKAREILALYEA